MPVTKTQYQTTSGQTYTKKHRATFQSRRQLVNRTFVYTIHQTNTKPNVARQSSEPPTAGTLWVRITLWPTWYWKKVAETNSWRQGPVPLHFFADFYFVSNTPIVCCPEASRSCMVHIYNSKSHMNSQSAKTELQNLFLKKRAWQVNSPHLAQRAFTKYICRRKYLSDAGAPSWTERNEDEKSRPAYQPFLARWPEQRRAPEIPQLEPTQWEWNRTCKQAVCFECAFLMHGMSVRTT